ALEKLLQRLGFSGVPTIHLCYNHADIALNEKIFAATVPAIETMQQLAVCVSHSAQPLVAENVRQQVELPVTHYLLSQAQTVFAELARANNSAWPPSMSQLEESPTVQYYSRILANFRIYQDFWYHTSLADIANYIQNPEGAALEVEEIQQYES
ncbi:MAG: hypothetical protein NUK65_04110, partial [Firmicutes bacterium]|nr:hypothetical protein [Bacillota bacterium]